MRKVVVLAVVTCLFAFAAQPAWSHCEIPCGIYNDQMRFDMIEEHIATIEKSMKQIVELSGQASPNYNQLVRWIGNKEDHADALQHVVQQYFMTQRVKPVEQSDAAGYQKYVAQVTLLHEMLVQAMKSKQTTDLAHVEALRKLTAEFREAYLGPEDKTHQH